MWPERRRRYCLPPSNGPGNTYSVWGAGNGHGREGLTFVREGRRLVHFFGMVYHSPENPRDLGFRGGGVRQQWWFTRGRKKTGRNARTQGERESAGYKSIKCCGGRGCAYPSNSIGDDSPCCCAGLAVQGSRVPDLLSLGSTEDTMLVGKLGLTLEIDRTDHRDSDV